MRNRGNVGDAADLDAKHIQGAHSGFASGTGTLDANLQILDAALLRGLARSFGRNLSSERGRLARTLEPGASGSRPRQGITLAIRDRDYRVVEGGMHMRNAFGNVLFDFLSRLDGRFSHNVCSPDYFLLPATDLRGPLRVLAFVRVR